MWFPERRAKGKKLPHPDQICARSRPAYALLSYAAVAPPASLSGPQRGLKSQRKDAGVQRPKALLQVLCTALYRDLTCPANNHDLHLFWSI